MSICECGCKQEAGTRNYEPYTIRRFIHGHNRRGKHQWLYGKTKETHPEISIKIWDKLNPPNKIHPMKNKKHSKESKEKMSKTRKQLIKEGKVIVYGYGREIPRNPFKGKHHSEKTKEMIRGKRLHQVFPVKDTSIEIKLQNKLKELKIEFKTHKAIIGQPDIFIQPNICIFADGCYWHGCQNCYDKNKFDKIQRYSIAKDTLTTQNLINKGYIVLRFWEHEINSPNFDITKLLPLNTINRGLLC